MAHEKQVRSRAGRSFPGQGWIVGYYPDGRPIPVVAGGDGTDGAAPGATSGPGATPGQQPPTGTPAGATPAGAAGSPPATAHTEPTPPATGADGLGDAGRRAIEQEREAARTAREQLAAANAELEQLRGATQTETERAISQARREAKAEADARWSGHIRTAEVRSQLRAAGMPEKTLELAVLYPSFATLKVDADTGTVEKVAETIETFKENHPELFAPVQDPSQPQGGSWDGSAGGGRGGQADTLEAAVMQRLAKQTSRT